MTLVAPVNLPYNVKTLWFDPQGLDIHADDKVVVKTARGVELGVAASDVIEVDDAQIAELKSPLQPVMRLATEGDIERACEMECRARDAMPIFKEMARETSEEMHPVSVEYMLDGDKAVFYFESEKRVDFRDLVRKLAATFHVRIDMRQIGVRDEARIVGGLAHCGQIVCCKRLGGEFKPVSIRMAKDQDLSLNSEKISGLCGRLMCCLRYENAVYKEFKAHAPKVGADVQTPDGKGKVVEIDVPRETIAIRVEDEKPVSVSVSAVEDLSEDRKSCVIDDEAWQEAVDEARNTLYGTSQVIDLPMFTGEDKLGSAQAVHHESASDKNRSRTRGSKAKGSSSSAKGKNASSSTSSHKSGKNSNGQEGDGTKRMQRRRSTKISGSSGEKETTAAAGNAKISSGNKKNNGNDGGKSSSKRRRGGSRDTKPTSGVRPGQKSSGLSQGRQAQRSEKKSSQSNSSKNDVSQRTTDHGVNGTSSKSQGSGNRRRRRRRRSGAGSSSEGASGSSGLSSDGTSYGTSEETKGDA